MPDNIKMSGFTFNENEAHLELKFKILNSIMIIAMIFSLLFAVLSDLKINDIGHIHSKVDYFYSLSSLILLILLRRSKLYFKQIATVFLGISLLVFVSALIFVVNDEFRIIWFYFLIYVTYILLGSYAGTLMTGIIIVSIFIINNFIDLNISVTAIYTAILGLLIAGLLSRTYTRQMELYENQLREKNDQLAQNIGQLDLALVRSNEASNAKSLFLAKMSHEMRTPLNGVVGMVEVLRNTSLDETQRHYLDTLDSSSNILLLLIDDLLDISRIESGKISLNIEDFKLFDWITNIQNLTEPLFDNKQTTFITEIEDDLPDFLTGDSNRLLQIVVNLITNAEKATPKGFVKLSIGGERLSASKFKLRIEIQDSGIGMEADELETIFDAFAQLKTDRSNQIGLGLGLSICNHLSNLMKGKIQVFSEVGAGSKFIFDVTLSVPGRKRLDKSKQGLDEINKGLKILLVDDDSINRLAAHTLLESRSHIVTEAEDGQIALEKIKNNKFDVILMDVHMPIMGGIEATQIIRNEYKNYDSVPIIGLTASVMEDEKVVYLGAGMNAVVEKPVQIDQLMQTISRLL